MQRTTATETLSSSWAKKLEIKAKRQAIMAMEKEMRDTKLREIEVHTGLTPTTEPCTLLSIADVDALKLWVDPATPCRHLGVLFVRWMQEVVDMWRMLPIVRDQHGVRYSFVFAAHDVSGLSIVVQQ